jgi:hypothetical protein
MMRTTLSLFASHDGLFGGVATTLLVAKRFGRNQSVDFQIVSRDDFALIRLTNLVQHS